VDFSRWPDWSSQFNAALVGVVGVAAIALATYLGVRKQIQGNQDQIASGGSAAGCGVALVWSSLVSTRSSSRDCYA
jgi:hypothetical protein